MAILALFKDKKHKANRFEYLDGYRGLSSILVILTHLSSNSGFSPQHLQHFYVSGYLGVSGFFVLSSFLLTFSLLNEFKKANSSQERFIIIVQYAIKRFLRIYFIFYLFCALVKFGPKFFTGPDVFSSFEELVLLKSIGPNHLWTFPPEIKNYFLIPIISIIAFHSLRIWWILAPVSMIFVYHFSSNYNLETIPPNLALLHRINLITQISSFWSGSMIAIFYFNLQSIDINSYLKLNFIWKQVLFNLIGIKCFLLLFYAIYYNTTYFQTNHFTIEKCSLIVSCLIFLMVISAPNLFTFLFSKAFLLTKLGKYNFGAYLFHMSFVNLHKYVRFSSVIEYFILVVTMCYVSGILVYYLVEVPFANISLILCDQVDRLLIRKSKINI